MQDTEAAGGKPIRLAVTLGDPRGIGPEVAHAATLAWRREVPDGSVIFIGPDSDTTAPADEYISVGSWESSQPISDAGAIAGRAIQKAVDLATSGAVDAIVTAPIDKAALNAGGYHFPGHTEMLAELTATPAVAMMMAAESTRLGGALRVVLATTHVSLASVPRLLTSELLVEQARLTWDALRKLWGIRTPRLALCAFNPHASDGGLFGDEEARIMTPAIEMLRADGVDIAGPLPADTVFVRSIGGEFDAVIAPYHDVGMAAFKTASFGQGVNVTLGLPFIRTSPDHGTAIDIAGKGAADPSSMLEAMRLASRLASAGHALVMTR